MLNVIIYPTGSHTTIDNYLQQYIVHSSHELFLLQRSSYNLVTCTHIYIINIAMKRVLTRIVFAQNVNDSNLPFFLRNLFTSHLTRLDADLNRSRFVDRCIVFLACFATRALWPLHHGREPFFMVLKNEENALEFTKKKVIKKIFFWYSGPESSKNAINF